MNGGMFIILRSTRIARGPFFRYSSWLCSYMYFASDLSCSTVVSYQMGPRVAGSDTVRMWTRMSLQRPSQTLLALTPLNKLRHLRLYSPLVVDVTASLTRVARESSLCV